MKVALVSLDQAWEDKLINIKRCENYIKKASDNKVDMVIFPEMTLTGFSPSSAYLAENLFNSETCNWFSGLSKRHSINVVFGAFIIDEEKTSFNMMFLSDRDGQVKSLYTKTHLFSYANEEQYLGSGNQINNYKIDEICFGFGICYDLRFPELFSIMSRDCEAIIVIANWPSVRIDHWNTLLKARAIENDCVVFGVNRVGSDGNGLEYRESSAMFLPDGSIQKPASSFELLKIYNIEKKQVFQYRKKFSTTQDKRFSLYMRYFET